MLRVSGLYSGYDGVSVIRGIDFNVESEIFAVLGANGAGKTTLLATLARLIPLMGGELIFQGQVVSDLPAWATAAGAGTRAFVLANPRLGVTFSRLGDGLRLVVLTGASAVCTG